MRHIAKTALPVLLASLLGGCAVGTVADAEKDIQRTRNDASSLRQTAARPMPAATVGPVEIKDEVFLGATAHRRETGSPLPRAVERDGVTFVSPNPMGLYEIGAMITQVTGIPIQYDSDMSDILDGKGHGDGDATSMGGDSASASPPASMGISNAPPSGLAAGPVPPGFDVGSILHQMGFGSQGGSQGGAGGQQKAARMITPNHARFGTMMVNHKGKLSAFLDSVASNFNIGWSYDGERIRFFRNLTRTYLVKALPTVHTMDMEITNQGKSGGGSSGGNSGGTQGESAQTSTSKVTVDVWGDIAENLKQVVGSSGRINASKSTGTMTVNAPPSVIKRVETWINGQNERFSKQVAISVQVLNVSLRDTDRYGFDLNALFSGSSVFSLQGGPIVSNIASAGGTGVNWAIIKPDSNWNGTSGIVEALSERGDVSVVTTASQTTLNNVPTPIQVGNSRNYVPEIQISDGASSGSGGTTDKYTVKTATVNTGFNMQALPRVTTNGMIQLQYNISMSELVGKKDGFDEFQFQGQTLQLANLDTRNFSQQVEIPNGATLVLAGFEQTRSSVNKRGVGTPENMLFGGSQGGSMSRQVMVVMITPVLIDAGKAIVEINS